MDDTHLADTRVTLQQGDALIEVVQLPEGNRIQVALADTTTELTRTGLYRFGNSQNARSTQARCESTAGRRWSAPVSRPRP